MEHNSTLHNISDTFRTRALTALALPHPFIMPSIASIAGALKGFRKHDIMKVVRTWSNSWTTSDRYKESCILPCLFGCRGELDSQKHYSKCPTLFAIVRCLRPSTPPCPKKRMGLLEPERDNLAALSCAYTGYHTLRRHPELHACMRNSLSLRTLSTKTFAESFFASACEISLACRRPFPLLRSHNFSVNVWTVLAHLLP